jgi:hypothetical protein
MVGEDLLNRFLQSVRIPNEWSFGVVKAQFPGIESFNRPRMQRIGIVWSVAVLLTNCHNCLYGGNCSMYFGLEPPALEDYLALPAQQ